MYRENFLELIERFGADRVVNVLAPHLLDRRKARIDEVIERRLGSVEVAIESLVDPYNALAVMRTAEALGVTRMHLIQTQVRKRARASMGTYRWIDCRRSSSVESFFEGRGRVFAADVSGKIGVEEIPVDKPLVLLFGNEHSGLSKEALNRADATFKIPIYGMVESYNLSVAAAIALFDVTKRRRQFLGSEGDLSEKEKVIERAFGYYQTVGPETTKKILCRN
ncbi:MAG: RNA methyltransferase [Candidatus Algichlamydia australiensis]|nr:RNA methyltransferase [Chlamydiales bacterium]